MSGLTGKTYVIRSIVDLLTIPRERREQCLSELQGWLAHVEEDMVRTVPASIGPFIWTDDGVGGVRVDPRYLERDRLIVGRGYLQRNVNDTAPRLKDQR